MKSFVLTSVPATLMSLIYGEVKPFIDSFMIAFTVNIFVYLKSEEVHANHIRTILGVLAKQKL